MTLTEPRWSATVHKIHGQQFLGLNTGFSADSIEGLRLVKVSRGEGWLVEGEAVRPWVTRGVVQQDKRLVIWGDLKASLSDDQTERWSLKDTEGEKFVRGLIDAWLTLQRQGTRLGNFGPAGVVPIRTAEGWAFLFPPAELAGILDSLLPLSEHFGWDHIRHPEFKDLDSWFFGSAALCLLQAAGKLPWDQANDEALRQELRDLKRTLDWEEVSAPNAAAQALWFESLTGRAGAKAVERWQSWMESGAAFDLPPSPERVKRRRESLEKRRNARRRRAAFWTRKGMLLTISTCVTLVIVGSVGSVIWNAFKPDPTENWTPRQVVEGYYQALNDLNSEGFQKLVQFNSSRQPALVRDQSVITNLYVIKQVRTAYEHHSPLISAQQWVTEGKQALPKGALLWGLSGLTITGQGAQWSATYTLWTSEASQSGVLTAEGTKNDDTIELLSTSRGWKVHQLTRDSKPLS